MDVVFQVAAISALGALFCAWRFKAVVQISMGHT
jgi:hypothetical protein